MALLPITIAIFVSVLHSTGAQYGVAQNGMVAVVTNGASAYGQMPVIELPPAEVAVIEEEPAMVDEAVVGAPVTRMFFRSNGVNYETSSAPVTNGYGAIAPATEPAVPANGGRFNRLFRANGQTYAIVNAGRNNGFARSNGATYGSSSAASNGARSNLFFRSSNGYETAAAPAAPTPAPVMNGYGTATSSNGAQSLRLFRSSAARRQRNFLRNNGFGRSGSYGASASATSANGYSTPAPAESQFLPTDLAEGVSIPQIPGVAGVDYPIYSQALVSAFNCEEKMAPGYYADIETKCQVFHLCQPYSDKTSFLCPNGTMFNEKYSVCDWWYNVKCETNGYNSYTSYTPQPATASPVQQMYQVQEEVPAVIEEVSEEPVADVAVDAAISSESNGEAVRMMRFRSNRLRSRGRSQLRFNMLRNNAGNYQQQSAAIAPEVAVTDAPAAQTNGYANGGGRSRIVLRTNRLRFRGMRNEAIGEVHYESQNGNGAVVPEAVPEEPVMTDATTVVFPETEGGDASILNSEAAVVEEAATVAEGSETGSEDASVNGSEEPVIVLLNGDAQTNGEGAVPADVANGGESSSTNGNGVAAAVNGNAYGGARFGRRLRPLFRSFVRPRQMLRSGLLRMASYDSSSVANNGNNAVFFRARRF
ncbi:hypothetical protein CHUAL_012546 [Chamberlinius hualienensis]